MKREVVDWSIEDLHKDRDAIAFPEYQRQPNLWSEEKQRLLIDSILRDIDIPKLYFNQTSKNGFEVVDGQQRLWAIWNFLDGAYAYKSNGQKATFLDLSPQQREHIKKYKLQVTVFDDADDTYLRELFIRLQLGLLLITGEKLHAATGEMKALVFERLARHSFIAKLGIPARRYARETLCAQICINSFSRAKLHTFARTRYEDLEQFFAEYAHPQGPERQLFDERAIVIARVLLGLWRGFGETAKQLRNRSYILSLYLLAEELDEAGELGSLAQQKKLATFALQLVQRLREEIRLGFDRKNRELYSFETLLSSAPGEKYQIEGRHERLREYYAHFKQTSRIKGDK
jgi:hypothetical protein